MDSLDTYLSDNHEYYGFKYSGVKGTCLRRKIGGWVNVTRYLSLIKSTRTNDFRTELEQDTKVLELRGKTINIAYTGCWVPLNRARELARKYAIYDQLRPLLGFDRVAKVNHCGVQLLEMFVIISFDVFVRILRRCDDNMVNMEGLFLLDKYVSPDGEGRRNIRRHFMKSYQGVRIESTEHTLLGGFWVPLSVARQFCAERGLQKYTDPILGFSLFPEMNVKVYTPLNSVEERLANTWIVESPNNSVFYGLPESFSILNFTKTSKPITLKDVCYTVQLKCNVKRGLTKKLVVLKRKSDSWVNASILINVCCSLRKAMSPNDTNVDNELYYHQMVYSFPFERVQFGRATTLNGRWVPLSHARELFKEMQVKFLGPYRKYITQLQKLLEPTEPTEEQSFDDGNNEVTILSGEPEDANASEIVPVPPISLSSDEEMDEPPMMKPEMIPEKKIPEVPETIILSDSEPTETTSNRVPQPAIQSSRTTQLSEKIREFGTEMDNVEHFLKEHKTQLDNILSDLGLLSGSEIRFMREIGVLKILETVNKRMTADMLPTKSKGSSEEINQQFDREEPSSSTNAPLANNASRNKALYENERGIRDVTVRAPHTSSSFSAKSLSTPPSSPSLPSNRSQTGWKQVWGVFHSILSKAQPTHTNEEAAPKTNSLSSQSQMTTAPVLSEKVDSLPQGNSVSVLHTHTKDAPSGVKIEAAKATTDVQQNYTKLRGTTSNLSRSPPVTGSHDHNSPSNVSIMAQNASERYQTPIQQSNIQIPEPNLPKPHSVPGEDSQPAKPPIARSFNEKTSEPVVRRRSPAQPSVRAQAPLHSAMQKERPFIQARQKKKGDKMSPPDPKRRQTMTRGDIVKRVRELHKPTGYIERILSAYSGNAY